MKRVFSFVLLIALLILNVGCRDKSDTSSISSVTTKNESESIESSLPSDTVSSEPSPSVPTEVSSQETVTEESKEAALPLYPMPEEVPAPVLNEGDFTIDLSFTGDMILAQYLNCPHQDAFGFYNDNYPNSYFLEEVKHIFENDDFTVVNLENVLSDRELEPIPKNYNPAFWFKAKASNIDILKCAGIDAVNLNNNHTGDYGSEGLADTIATVTNAGMQYGNNGNTILFQKNGFRIAVVCVGLWRESSVPLAVNILNRAKQLSDYQIVFFHGGTEKIHLPENEKIRGARALADNGADLIIGSHPHVLQPREFYNGVEIVYSLGNFCYGGSRVPENRTVIYTARLTVNSQNQLIHKDSELIPCFVYTGRINNYRPSIITDPTVKQHVLDFMDNKRSSPF